ncbi:hypothetical protein [Spirosoma sp. 209]|uniref:hypothetical protein n=1 Tax=Spirosoma sp. 209 TaxID=1955701 RepID=UPI00098D1A54|nr:hypothetical protein [Spirosoma sp. 209]
MTEPIFRYGDIKQIMHSVTIKLEDAGYDREAAAICSLTHIIACRIETPDVSSKWGVEYMLECMEHHQALTEYINNGNPV